MYTFVLIEIENRSAKPEIVENEEVLHDVFGGFETFQSNEIDFQVNFTSPI